MNYHNIIHDDMLNGDGLRVTLFVSGCDHRCKGCQNPQTWNSHNGIIFDDAAKREIFDELDKEYISGLTLSGGDPLHWDNYEEIFLLCRIVKELYPDKTIWMYTGFRWEDICDLGILRYIDVLVDCPFVEELKDMTYPWAGSTNQRVIDVQRSRRRNSIVLWSK